MIETNKDFALKHREDVIDTLKLRARERRVLYGLLVILLVTAIYENGGAIFSSLLGENCEVAALGERKSATIKPELLKRVSRALEPVITEYPQYAVRLESEYSSLLAAVKMASTPELAENTVNSSREVILSLFSFVSHPVVTRSKNIEALEKELNQAAKALQIKLLTKNEYPGFNFKKAAPVVEGDGQRNLFEFN